MIGRFFRDILTGTSNLEYEISRVLSLIAVASYVIYSGFHLFVNKTFDPLNYGAGFGAILLAAGFGTAAKDRAKNEATMPPHASIAAGQVNVNMGEKP